MFKIHQPLFNGHLPFPRGWSLFRGSTVLLKSKLWLLPWTKNVTILQTLCHQNSHITLSNEWLKYKHGLRWCKPLKYMHMIKKLDAQ